MYKGYWEGTPGPGFHQCTWKQYHRRTGNSGRNGTPSRKKKVALGKFQHAQRATRGVPKLFYFNTRKRHNSTWGRRVTARSRHNLVGRPANMYSQIVQIAQARKCRLWERDQSVVGEVPGVGSSRETNAGRIIAVKHRSRVVRWGRQINVTGDRIAHDKMHKATPLGHASIRGLLR